ncbi:regulatory protein RecX [Aquirufa sp. 2-AUSEE-184A6]|jgi:regulatory protein|uniref:Regulatory protein RecX n=1 Tax=Aquirufa novilacunae TaxID=3139305 RepID=A0ABW8SX62_9BACT
MNSEILQKLARYCAYQERCVQELEQKMKTFEVLPSEFSEYVAWLSENNYLNEARFVEIFVRSKFNQKGWGRTKINYELRKRGISASLLASAWDGIDDQDYIEKARTLLQKKRDEIKAGTSPQRYQKCYNYGLSKGYESSLVRELLKPLFA